MAVRTVIIVFKTHFDIGYTDLSSEVIRRFSDRLLPEVREVCRQTDRLGPGRRFVWTAPAWPITRMLDPEGTTAESREVAEELIRAGRLVWHQLPYTMHTEFLGLEELVRAFAPAAALERSFGRSVISAKMTDVPGHTWILPTLLAGAGVRFLHLGCNAGCKPPEVPRLFFWEGPDGSRVLTFYSKGGYGSDLRPPEDWPLSTWLAVQQTGDNAGAQSAETVAELLREAERLVPGAEVRTGTLDDFYHAIDPEELRAVPVIRKDLADTWIHGVGSYPVEVGQVREARPLLSELEKCATMLSRLAPDAPEDDARSRLVERAYESLLLFGEHTWGLDVKTTMPRRFYEKDAFRRQKASPEARRLERSWQEQRDRAASAAAVVEDLRSTVLPDLAAKVAVEGARQVVFNGSGRPRDAWVDVAKILRSAPSGRVVDLRTGSRLPIRRRDGREQVYVKDLPGFGFTTLVPAPPAAAEEPEPGVAPLSCDRESGVLENQWLRLHVDPETGRWDSFFDKRVGKEWIDASRRSTGGYRYDVHSLEEITELIRSYAYRFYDWLLLDLGRADYPEASHRTYSAVASGLEGRIDEETAALTAAFDTPEESYRSYGNARRVEIEWRLSAGEPWVDVYCTVVDKQETPFVESGHWVVPLDLPGYRLLINKVGSVVEPARDVAEGANHGLHCCEGWLDLTDGRQGLAVIPFDAPLFSVGRPEILRYAPRPEPREPVLCFNLWNNAWGTNFPQWIGGNMRFRFRLIPHAGLWSAAGIQRTAWESILPTPTGSGSGAPGLLPSSMELARVPEGVVITAMKRAFDERGIVVRLRELDGIRRRVRIALSRELDATSVTSCDLCERPIRPRDASTESSAGAPGAVEAELAPFGIWSYRIE